MSSTGAQDEGLPVKDQVLETGASVSQSFGPIKQICAHLNAFHVYASDPKRCVEANHYCSHISKGWSKYPRSSGVGFGGQEFWVEICPDVRQCLIYDSPKPNARLIGVEHMITPALYETLDQEERRLWHSHVFEVKSGMLVMPGPSSLPSAAWELAETKEMEEVVGLYGKTYHFWQVDRGDSLPLGKPELMMSFTNESQVPAPGFKNTVGERDQRYGVNHEKKAEKREHIEEPEVHADADSMWK